MWKYLLAFVLGCFAKKIWRFSWAKVQAWLSKN